MAKAPLRIDGVAVAPPDLRLGEIFVCDQVGVWNWMRWCSEEYDALYNESNTSQDPAERARIHAEMEQIWNDAVHTIWLTHGRSAFAGRADLMVDYETSNNYIVYSMRPAE